MAKGNLILGTMSGKLGDVVAYTNNGKQCARVRRRTVRNPNSAGQQVQRMILSTVAQFVSAFRPILNNGFESIQKGAPSLAYARKLAMSMLRTEDMYREDNHLRYVLKGGKYLAPNRYRVSEGSLSVPQFSITSASGDAGGTLSNLCASSLTTTSTASALFPFASIGMQHTFAFVGMVENVDGKPATFCDFIAFVFADDTTPALIAAENSLLKINPAAIDANFSQGEVDKLRYDPATGTVSYLSSGTVVAATYILSSKDGSKRSTATLLINVAGLEDFDFTWAPDQVVDSYDNSGVDSGAPAEYYLDNNAGGN